MMTVLRICVAVLVLLAVCGVSGEQELYARSHSLAAPFLGEDL